VKSYDFVPEKPFVDWNEALFEKVLVPPNRPVESMEADLESLSLDENFSVNENPFVKEILFVSSNPVVPLRDREGERILVDPNSLLFVIMSDFVRDRLDECSLEACNSLLRRNISDIDTKLEPSSNICEPLPPDDSENSFFVIENVSVAPACPVESKTLDSLKFKVCFTSVSPKSSLETKTPVDEYL
jgi:hypothetical protein